MAIELIKPEMKERTLDDDPFFRLDVKPPGSFERTFDMKFDLEGQYGSPFNWVREFASQGWNLPSLFDYHAIFSALYDLRDSGNENVERLRNSFSRGELSWDTPPTATSSLVDKCECGNAKMYHSFGQPDLFVRDFPSFTSGRIGEHADHQDALRALLGTGDVDRIAAVWEWVSETDNYLVLDEKAKERKGYLTLTLGKSYHQLGGGIVLSDYCNVSIGARAVKKEIFGF